MHTHTHTHTHTHSRTHTHTHAQGIKQLHHQLKTGPTQSETFRAEIFCHLGHLHLLIEEYTQGTWKSGGGYHKVRGSRGGGYHKVRGSRGGGGGLPEGTWKSRGGGVGGGVTRSHDCSIVSG